ncbi:Pimeloyl-ACP methyl ester carboxylesterase [Variovorax sp. OK605]|jgi:pimeloyl-ACP methyl ester carboxylesterase|uniref:alpha/beta fold hydrolase n=1 Tax=unclassified Variovorax TaxID=663243 RepID=UPI0008B13556|nr:MULTISPECIES: alpha/beta hydrolase [unclassified Variovorax]SEK11717.1 Pimeloyl-ACP methyl ester carboxylesterase [Variovorax sp. OK202]SFD76041.1 Pimeloyl-ACP methyl ester carboxylesterase [Variovorax sp. OK212]SFQ00482.1 Pimeloyl-ACP methyl ester carboxylesterase [Variovorax sp. OK605]
MSAAAPRVERRTRANGIELAWDSFGDPGAPPMLLVMGLGAQMVAWDDAFCARLAEAGGLRVIRFDNRDIGHSTYLTHLGVPDIQALMLDAMAGRALQVPYTLRDMAADCVGLLDALGIARAHVVGASMGGAIGQELCIHHAHRLLSFTSIMSTTGAPGLPPPTPEAMAMLFSPSPTNFEAYLPHYAKVWRVLRGPSAFPLDEARDTERAQLVFLRGLNPPGVARQLAAILASGNRGPALRGVRVPTLVIHGDADPLVPVACGVDVADAIPGATLLRIPRMGHALPVSMWPQIVEAIAGHAGRHPDA